MALSRIETQAYRTLLKEKNFEIRHYPAAIKASYYVSAANYRSISSSGFRRLANFIFGSNNRNEKIAMTAPVHMDINPTKSSMSFVMPSKYSDEDLPQPNDKNVVIEKSDDEVVAAIRFRGFASDARLKRYSDHLRSILDEKGIKHSGNFRYLGYDPPYRIVGRRNEMIVEVDWKE